MSDEKPPRDGSGRPLAPPRPISAAPSALKRPQLRPITVKAPAFRPPTAPSPSSASRPPADSIPDASAFFVGGEEEEDPTRVMNRPGFPMPAPVRAKVHEADTAPPPPPASAKTSGRSLPAPKFPVPRASTPPPPRASVPPPRASSVAPPRPGSIRPRAASIPPVAPPPRSSGDVRASGRMPPASFPPPPGVPSFTRTAEPPAPPPPPSFTPTSVAALPPQPTTAADEAWARSAPAGSFGGSTERLRSIPPNVFRQPSFAPPAEPVVATAPNRFALALFVGPVVIATLVVALLARF